MPKRIIVLAYGYSNHADFRPKRITMHAYSYLKHADIRT